MVLDFPTSELITETLEKMSSEHTPYGLTKDPKIRAYREADYQMRDKEGFGKPTSFAELTGFAAKPDTVQVLSVLDSVLCFAAHPSSQQYCDWDCKS